MGPQSTAPSDECLGTVGEYTGTADQTPDLIKRKSKGSSILDEMSKFNFKAVSIKSLLYPGKNNWFKCLLTYL